MKTLTKSLIIVLALTIVYTMQSYAQEGHGKSDRDKEMAEKYAQMKSMKIAYISEHLQLTPDEAQKFWPLYNEYENKRDKVTKDLFKRFEKPDEKPANISDEEADKIVQQRFGEEQALLNLKTEYYSKYKEVMPPSKILKLYEVENNFRRGLMERMGRGRSERDERSGSREKPFCGKQHYR